MLYQRPLAYLLDLEGVALLRAFAGDHDRDLVEARLAEAHQLLNVAELRDDGVDIRLISTIEGLSRLDRYLRSTRECATRDRTGCQLWTLRICGTLRRACAGDRRELVDYQASPIGPAGEIRTGISWSVPHTTRRSHAQVSG
jgi:hypothetical protein